MDPQDAVAVFLLSAFASTAQAITGFGFGLLIIPPLILFLGPRDAVVFSTLIGTGLSVLMLGRLYPIVPWRPLGLAVVAAILGMPVGLFILVALNRDVLQVIIAISVLISTVLIARGFRLPPASTAGSLGAGFIAGVTRMAAGLPGPPVVLYFRAAGLTPAAQRAIVTAFFVATGLVGIALFAGQGSLDARLALLGLPAAPGIVAGWWAGNHLFDRINERLFAGLVYTMLVASSILAILTAIT